MRTCFIALLILSFSINSFAQFKVIAESKKISEPAYGSSILLMKNGNTVLLSMGSGGIDIRIYDAKHELLLTSTVLSSISLRAVNLENSFDIDGSIALFVSGLDENSIPTLTRFLIDAGTGKLKEQKTLVTSDKRGKFNNTSASFWVKKDPASDNYAVAAYHILQDDREKRLEIIQYDEHNTEVKRTFLVSPDNDDHKFMVIMDMLVTDAGRVNVIAYNGKEKYFSGAKKGRLLMATVDKKDPKPVYTVINLPEEIQFDFCRMVYLSATKKIYALAGQSRHKDNPVTQYYIKIDPQTGTSDAVSFTKVPDELNKKLADQYGFKRGGDYDAPVTNFEVNNDESFSVVYEESYAYTATGGGMGFGTTGSTSTFYTGKILVADHSKQGVMTNAYFAPKLFIVDTYSPYKQFKYINTGKNSYICFNDTERNNDAKKNKFVEIRGVGELDAFYYKKSGTESFPGRNYLLGHKEKGHDLLAFGTSYYDKDKNLLITLRLTKDSPSDNNVNLIWLQPE